MAMLNYAGGSEVGKAGNSYTGTLWLLCGRVGSQYGDISYAGGRVLLQTEGSFAEGLSDKMGVR